MQPRLGPDNPPEYITEGWVVAGKRINKCGFASTIHEKHLETDGMTIRWQYLKTDGVLRSSIREPEVEMGVPCGAEPWSA
jgi:hypothetical protein